jgi:L-seryl-tRNA(Ser) seleniumtransferase
MDILKNEYYNKLGVRRVINCASYLTMLGGSIMPREVLEAMDKASEWFVDMKELNKSAGEVIANFTGAEAGLVTAGAASGLMLQTAACIAGSDPKKIDQLPNTEGLRNEFIIHRSHRTNYDHNYRNAGAKLIEIGNTGGTYNWELESNINENTAGIIYVYGPKQAGAIEIEKVIEIAHNKNIPVIVDAAALLPPIENLQKFTKLGADMVAYSGGKGLRGPQSTGILCGRKNLIDAAYLNSAPNNEGIGRVSKVSKEEIIGLITALELFIDRDHSVIMQKWENDCEIIINKIKNTVKDVNITFNKSPSDPNEINDEDSTHPSIIISSNHMTDEEIEKKLSDGNPSIRVRNNFEVDGVKIYTSNLQENEASIVADKLLKILSI